MSRKKERIQPYLYELFESMEITRTKREVKPLLNKLPKGSKKWEQKKN